MKTACNFLANSTPTVKLRSAIRTAHNKLCETLNAVRGHTGSLPVRLHVESRHLALASMVSELGKITVAGSVEEMLTKISLVFETPPERGSPAKTFTATSGSCVGSDAHHLTPSPEGMRNIETPMDLVYMCVKPQMRLYVCHQMRLLTQRSSLRLFTFARFVRTFF